MPIRNDALYELFSLRVFPFEMKIDLDKVFITQMYSMFKPKL